MKIENFNQMYLSELQEIASAERYFGEALARMEDAASHADLKEILRTQRDESEK